MGNTNYHLQLGLPTVATTATVTVPTEQGHAAYVKEAGGCVGELNNPTWMIGQILTIMSSLDAINPSTLPIFLTEDVFFGEIGEGYHGVAPSAGFQTYIWATYNDLSNQYCGSQGMPLCPAADVSGLSHEVGEWADDPWGHTPSPCGGWLEVADPLSLVEGYTVNGFTYHLVDLAFLTWFGAPTTMSYGYQMTFDNENLAVCQP